MISETQNTEQLLFEKILSFKYDPVGFVQYVFPWREKNSPLAEMDGPRNWQIIELEKNHSIVSASIVNLASAAFIASTRLIFTSTLGTSANLSLLFTPIRKRLVSILSLERAISS
jgi:hypothetical protein